MGKDSSIYPTNQGQTISDRDFLEALGTVTKEGTFRPLNTVFKSGATSTTKKPSYHLIPLAALKRLAARFEYGAKKHGDVNYRKGANDSEFLQDRRNHLIEHALKYATGDRSIDHLGAILCNAAILTELEDIRGEKVPPQEFEDRFSAGEGDK